MALLLFEVMSALEALPRASMPATHRLVLMTLANYAGESGRAWPAVPTVATITGLGVSTVRRCIGELEAAGWLTRTARSNGKGQTTNVYDVRASGGAVQAAAPARSERGPRPERAGGAPASGGAPARSERGPRPEREGPPPGAGDDLLMDLPMEPPSEPQPPLPPVGGCAPADAGRVDGPDVGAGLGEPEAVAVGDLVPASAIGRADAGTQPSPAEPPKPAAAPELFPGLDVAAPASPSTPAARAGRKAPHAKAPRPARASSESSETRYRKAYEAGMRDAAPEHRFALTGKISGVLGPALTAHAVATDGAPLKLEALDAWIRGKVAEFRRDTAAEGWLFMQWAPVGFVKWLNAGGSKRAGPARGRAVHQPMNNRPISVCNYTDEELEEVKGDGFEFLNASSH